MNGNTPSGNYAFILTICMLALVLAVAWPDAAANALEVQEDNLPEVPPVGENEGALPTRQQPSPTPATTGNGGTPTPTPDANLSVYRRFDPSAPNRIVFHAATPVQLCKEGDGLQVFFVGSDGTTRPAPGSRPSANSPNSILKAKPSRSSVATTGSPANRSISTTCHQPIEYAS